MEPRASQPAPFSKSAEEATVAAKALGKEIPVRWGMGTMFAMGLVGFALFGLRMVTGQSLGHTALLLGFGPVFAIGMLGYTVSSVRCVARIRRSGELGGCCCVACMAALPEEPEQGVCPRCGRRYDLAVVQFAWMRVSGMEQLVEKLEAEQRGE
jgi:hypothetical protein